MAVLVAWKLTRHTRKSWCLAKNAMFWLKTCCFESPLQHFRERNIGVYWVEFFVTKTLLYSVTGCDVNLFFLFLISLNHHDAFSQTSVQFSSSHLLLSSKAPPGGGTKTVLCSFFFFFAWRANCFLTRSRMWSRSRGRWEIWRTEISRSGYMKQLWDVRIRQRCFFSFASAQAGRLEISQSEDSWEVHTPPVDLIPTPCFFLSQKKTIQLQAGGVHRLSRSITAGGLNISTLFSRS